MIDNRLEIIVEVPNIPPTDPTSNVYGITRYYLDTYGSDQEPMELNFVVNDIKDLSNRNASSSKTLSLPETPNNREVFGFVSDLNTNTLLFSPNKRTKCYVLVDSIEVFQGWLQLKNIKPNYRTGLNKLEVVIYSNQLDFFKAVGESYLQDLQGFKTSNFTHSLENMTASWFKDQTQTDIYYPLIDYGFSYDDNFKEISTGFTGSFVGTTNSYVNVNANNQMFPAVYLKSVTDCIFTSASGSNYYYNGITQSYTYQYDSYFFNSPFYRSLIIPYANGPLTQKTTQVFYGTYASSSFSLENDYVPYYFIYNPVRYGYFELFIDTIPDVPPQYIYKNNQTLQFLFTSTFTATITSGIGNLDYYLIVVKNDGGFYQVVHKHWYITSNQTITSNDTISYVLAEGEYFYYFIESENSMTFTNVVQTVNITNYSNTLLDVPIRLGDTFDVNKVLPANIKQKDFLTTLFNMFNLYIDYDPNVPNILRIEPRDDYYYFNGSQSTFYQQMDNYGSTYFNPNNLVIKDWSNKVDINEDVNIAILANTQYKTINLTYKEDKDYYNYNYIGYINRVYGNKLIEVDNDFNVGQQNIEVLFGPTVLANIYNTYNFPIPNLTKQIDTVSNVPSGRSNAIVKIMQRYWYYLGTSSNVITNEPLSLILQNDHFVLSQNIYDSENIYVTQSYTYSYYPYAGNFNNPYFPSAD